MLNFKNKSEVKRCRKHENAKILYTGQICPLCDINERLTRLNILADRILEQDKKISSIAKAMELMF